MSFKSLAEKYPGFEGLFAHIRLGFETGRSADRMRCEAKRWINSNISIREDKGQAMAKAEAYIVKKTFEREEAISCQSSIKLPGSMRQNWGG